MTRSIMIMALMVGDVGPRDAYLANLSAVQCRVNYRFCLGTLDGAIVKDARFWNQLPSLSNPPVGYPLEMFWTADGAHWLLEFRPDEADRRPNIPRLKIGLDYVPRPFQQLNASEFDATYHWRGRGVSVSPAKPFDHLQVGPFCWGPPWTFLHEIAQHFPRPEPQRFPALRDGRPLIVEVYTRDLPTPGWHQLEIWYDPNTGYLPRHIRAAVFEKPILYVQEYRLLQTQVLDSGGFLPTQWMHIQFQLPDYSDQAIRYRHDTVVNPPGGPIDVKTYEALSVKPWREPVALHDLQSVRVLGSPGGQVDMPKNQDTLTAEDIRRLLGSRIFQKSNQLGMNVDVADLEKYSNRTRPPNHWPWVIGSALLLITLLALLWLKRARSALPFLLLLTLPWSTGCTPPSQGPPRLTARFDQDLVLLEDNVMRRDLIIRNSGQTAVLIKAIHGSCVCSQLDVSRLPIALLPGREDKFQVQISDRGSEEPAAYPFQVETDQGVFNLSATCLAFHRYRMIPEELAWTGAENAPDPEFEIEFRHIIPENEQPISPRLILPKGYQRIDHAQEQQPIPLLPAHRVIRDRVRFALRDHALGLIKDPIKWIDDSSGREWSIPLSRNRVPFLASAPARVILGPHPVRVFLRCPDESVELTQVLAAPPGIKAVLAGPRELSIRLEPDAPELIDATISVAVSAPNQPPLSIPVVRYAPKILASQTPQNSP